MSRRKIAKKAKTKKTTVKRTTKTANTSTSALEKSFRDTPSKLIAQCRKELATLKQQEKKVQAELQKAQQQKKKSQQQVTTLTTKQKSKPSATTKKQLTKHNQAVAKSTKVISGLTTRLNDLKTQSKTLTQHQNKQTALNKLLTAFDKDWNEKQRKAAQAANKPRKKTQKRTKVTTQQTQETAPPINDETIVTTQKDFEVVE